MKIGIVLDPNLKIPGGVQEHCRGLYDALVKLGREVVIIVGNVFELRFLGRAASVPLTWQAPGKIRQFLNKEKFERRERMLRCGVDLVFISEFQKRAKRSGEGFLRKIFLESELKNTEVSHLARVFAAKEAVMKALGLPVGSWHRIEVSYQKSGKPGIKVLDKRIKDCDLSISHAGDYAVAVFVGEVEEGCYG